MKREVIIGERYRHCGVSNIEYIVDNIVIDATGYEETGSLGKAVIYRQVVAGIYPVGTIYSRSVEDFLGQTVCEGRLVNKFELVSERIL